MDPAHEWADAVAIRGESIVAVSYITGDTEGLRETPAALEIRRRGNNWRRCLTLGQW